MKRPSVWLLAVVSILALVVAPLFVAALSSGCAATQTPRPWNITAGAAIVLSAHLVDGADSYAASRYAAAAQVPGVNLSTVDARYAAINTAVHLARPALLSAQSEVNTIARLLADRNSTEAAITSAKCSALSAIRESRVAITFLGESLVSAGFADAPALTEGVNALASAIASGPLCRTAEEP